MPDLTPKMLQISELAQVYPLVRSATHVSLDRWKAFGRDLLEGGGGVLSVKAADECIHGVAAFRPIRHLRHEMMLDVELIVAFDLIGDDRVREVLYRELERIAVNLKCSTVKITVAAKIAERRSRVRTGLERLGLSLDTANFVRELPSFERRARAGSRSRAPRKRQ